MDDVDLKNLLDEAYTYKSPKDRAQKSAMFNELLQHAELEEKLRTDGYRNSMLSGRHPASSSLQDLVEAVGNEYGHGRRLHHNSRHKKNSSVSSRERESGSLPINVNSNLSPNEASFMMEYKRGKNKLTKMQSASNCISASSANAGPLVDAALQAASVEVEFPIVENLEIKQAVVVRTDPDDVNIIDRTLVCVNGNDFMVIRKYSPNKSTLIREINLMNWKDPAAAAAIYARSTPVSINDASLRHTSEVIASYSSDANTTSTPNDTIITTFEDGVTYCSPAYNTSGNDADAISGTDGAAAISSSSTIDPALPSGLEGGAVSNPLASSTANPERKTKNTNRTDRKTKVLLAKEIPGNRGDHDLDHLVAFVENNDKVQERIRKMGLVNKRHAGNKKDTNTGNTKLKKSNSMEDLKSRSKIEQEAVQSKAKAKSDAAAKSVKNITTAQVSETVTLRNKPPSTGALSKKVAISSSGETFTKDTSHKQQQKRGERRSWGTEELTYLGDANALVSTVNKKEELIVAPAVNLSQSQTTSTKVSTHETDGAKAISSLPISANLRDDQLLSLVSIESLPTSNPDNSEFLMVTKKKKLKKRSATLEETSSMRPMHKTSGAAFNASNPNRRFDASSIGYTNNRGKYQTSHNYSNDREAYMQHSDHPHQATSYHHQNQHHHHQNSASHHDHHSHRQSHGNHPNNRRKSASSVPPSEKSDSSDRESVISLPIESTIRSTPTKSKSKASRAQTKSSNPKATTNEPVATEPAQTSYADIARISNPVEKIPVTATVSKATVKSSSILSPDHLDEWPAVSSNKSTAVEQLPDLNSNTITKSCVNSVINNTKSTSEHIPTATKPETSTTKKQSTTQQSSAPVKKENTNHRQAVVIMNDGRRRDNAAENLSASPPLLFGDFNDDVLRLLEQDTDSLSSSSATNPIIMPAINTSRSPPVAAIVVPTERRAPSAASSQARTSAAAVAQSHVDALAKQSTMSFLGNAIDLDTVSFKTPSPPSATVANTGVAAPTTHLGKKAKREAAKLARADSASIASAKLSPANTDADITPSDPHSHRQPPSSVAATSGATPPNDVAKNTTGTSVSVAAALEAIAQQNQSAVNSMATVTVRTADDVTLRYVEPPASFFANRLDYNHEKIVNFLGMAWNDIVNSSPKYFEEEEK